MRSVQRQNACSSLRVSCAAMDAMDCLDLGERLLAHFLKVAASDLTWRTFLSCRCVCRSLWKIPKEYHRHGVMLDHLKASAAIANQIVSGVAWSSLDPRCCFRECHYGGRTGLYVPLCIPKTRMTDQEQRTFASLWWRNRPSLAAQVSYGSSNPQIKVDDWIARGPPRCVARDPQIARSYYVVCSEDCYVEVQKALETIWVRKRRCHDYEVLLGVERMYT